MLEGYELILGDSWLKSHGAQMDFRLNRLLLLSKGRAVALQCSTPLTAAEPGPVKHAVVSALQAKRMLRKAQTRGDHVFLVHVKGVDEAKRQEDEGPDDPRLMPHSTVKDMLNEYPDVFPK